MADHPIPYDPEVDVPLDQAAIQGVTDPRVQAVAERAQGFIQYVRETIPSGPYVEQAARYVDLAVQACHQAAQESPPEAPGTPSEQP
jgi:hypothetical protein